MKYTNSGKIVLIATFLGTGTSGCGHSKPLSNMSPQELVQELVSGSDPTPEKVLRIEQAAKLLMRGGDKSHSVLVDHLKDQRPSVFFDGDYECTVGDTCYHILRDQLLNLPEEYKSLCDTEKRFSARGNYCWHPYMFTPGFSRDANWFHGPHITVERWLTERKHLTLLQKQIDVREWLIASEEKLGFQTEESKERYLGPLQRGLEEMKRSRARLRDGQRGRDSI